MAPETRTTTANDDDENDTGDDDNDEDKDNNDGSDAAICNIFTCFTRCRKEAHSCLYTTHSNVKSQMSVKCTRQKQLQHRNRTNRTNKPGGGGKQKFAKTEFAHSTQSDRTGVL